MDIPITLVGKLVRELIESGVVSETKPYPPTDASAEPSPICYQPAFDIAKMTITRVVQMWEAHGQHDIAFGQSEEVQKISETTRALFAAIEKSPDNKLLKSI